MRGCEVPVFETTLQKTHLWLKELTSLMGWHDEQRSYLAIRAVLQALRDRLPVEVAAKVGAQLPMLLRGIYYESWVPSHTPLKVHNLQDFLILVASNLGNDDLVHQTAKITQSVFQVMKNHLSSGEIEHLKKALPESIAAFLP